MKPLCQWAPTSFLNSIKDFNKHTTVTHCSDKAQFRSLCFNYIFKFFIFDASIKASVTRNERGKTRDKSWEEDNATQTPVTDTVHCVFIIRFSGRHDETDLSG